MATKVPSPRELQRRTALAHLDAEELLLKISSERAAIDSRSKSSGVPPAELGALFATLVAMTERIVEGLDVPIGVPVEQAADRLAVTSPTVRKWLAEGLLQRTADRKPVEIDPHSLLQLEHALDAVRDNYPSRQWGKALAAFLHDQDLQRQPWATKGLSEFERGELVEH